MPECALSAGDRTLNPAQVAAALGVNEATLTRWRMHGRGPAYQQDGSRYVYRAHDVEAWQDRLGAAAPVPVSTPAEAVLQVRPDGVAVLSVLHAHEGGGRHHFEVRRDRELLGVFTTLQNAFWFLRATDSS